MSRRRRPPWSSSPGLAAAGQARRTLERLVLRDRVSSAVRAQLGVEPAAPRRVLCLPALVARSGFYAQVHARLPDAPPLIDEFDRDAVMRASAADAVAAGAAPLCRAARESSPRCSPSTTRSSVSGARVDDFQRLLAGTLASEADTDRGAARLLEQTRFLVEAFRAFERRSAALQGIDEHALRARAAREALLPALAHVVVTVGDITAERSGLWPADYDLLATMPGLERIDVIATDATLSAGLDERLEQRLPGIANMRVDDFSPQPVLVAPEHSEGGRVFVSRDREEELVGLVRTIKAEHAVASGGPPRRQTTTRSSSSARCPTCT